MQSVANALSTTADRYSTAAAAGNTKAAKKQQKQATKLTHKLNFAIHARAHAGTKFATLLRSAGVTGTLTGTQTTQAANTVFDQLASHGLSRDAATALLGSAASPPPVDVLATFGQ